MAFSRKDFEKVALGIRGKEKVVLGGRQFFFDRQAKYMTALFMRDYFMSVDPLFDGNAFLTMCGF